MKRMKLWLVAGIVAATTGSAWAIGGVLSDGSGTNWSYGDLYGQGTYYLRNWKTADVDGAGVTNIPSAGIVSLDASKLEAGTAIPALDLGAGTNVPAGNLTGTVDDARLSAALQKLAADDGGSLTNIISDGIVSLDAAKLQAGTVMPAVDGSAITNLPAATSLDAANLVPGSVASAIDGNAITNLNAANLAAGGVLSALDGSALTNLSSAGLTGVLLTNDSAQAKAGKLTLNGGLEVGGTMVLTLGAVETIAEGGAVPASAANVKVVGDSAPVTATVADGATEGQVLTIRGTDDTDTVTLTNTAVVPNFKIGLGDVISFTWDGSAWVEVLRRDN